MQNYPSSWKLPFPPPYLPFTSQFFRLKILQGKERHSEIIFLQRTHIFELTSSVRFRLSKLPAQIWWYPFCYTWTGIVPPLSTIFPHLFSLLFCSPAWYPIQSLLFHAWKTRWSFSSSHHTFHRTFFRRETRLGKGALRGPRRGCVAFGTHAVFRAQWAVPKTRFEAHHGWQLELPVSTYI